MTNQERWVAVAFLAAVAFLFLLNTQNVVMKSLSSDSIVPLNSIGLSTGLQDANNSSYPSYATAAKHGFQELQFLEPAMKDDFNLNDFLVGPGLSEHNTTDSIDFLCVCDIVLDSLTFNHVHAAEQLYMCFSWFLAHPNSKHVLVVPEERKGPDKSSSHGLKMVSTAGLINAFARTFFGLQMVPYLNETQGVHRVSRNKNARGYDGTNPFRMVKGHSKVMRDAVANATNVPNRPCQEKPRVGILDRMKQRHISILVNMTNGIQEYFGNQIELQVIYFENTTFEEQIGFMLGTDILISPHGAQLALIPFLPDCASVTEIFPPGYHIPTYFGSLAAMSQVRHSFIYTGWNVTEETKRTPGKELRERIRARARNITMEVETLLGSIEHLAGQWKDCCLASHNGTRGL